MPLKTVFNNNYFINKTNFVLTNKKTRKGRPFKKTGTCFLSIKIIYRPEKSRETIPLSHTVLAVYIYSAGCLTPLNVLTIKFCGSFLCLLQNWYLPQILHCITWFLHKLSYCQNLIMLAYASLNCNWWTPQQVVSISNEALFSQIFNIKHEKIQEYRTNYIWKLYANSFKWSMYD